jgi:2,4-dienoyl-CoA reductase-like NADH-dependent reductase (Old Yellow Enzyme family)
MRLTQVKKLTDARTFREHVAGLGIEIELDEQVEPQGALAEPVTFTDGSAGSFTSPNRFAILPMEGWDGESDGRPTDLVRRRWNRFATGGAGLVWAEATAVVPEGRANPNQLVMAAHTVEAIAAMRAGFAADQVVGLQLTHSGRYCRPVAAPAPRTAYRHPLLDGPSGADAASILSDDELDDLVGRFVDAAVLAAQAGFDFVDVKACHGYLGHELLSAYDRPGRYGGDLDGRTSFFRSRSASGCRSSTSCRTPPAPTGEVNRSRPATTPTRSAVTGPGSGST